ncbi:MAG: ADP-glyceromanno-heptose 6-epimerase [Bacteroidetes bacterium]|nr:MAG: ADP-glyceromanno-heptose 6-epimerase [Bacteroidota bacterium]
MDKTSTIVVTGAAGFIGSCLVEYLNYRGFANLLLVDDFSRPDKKMNLEGKKFIDKIEREQFFEWLFSNKPKIDFIFHIGARTDTTEFNYAVHQHLNLEYSKKVWQYCVVHDIPLVYASSAATYGGGEFGYDDSHELVNILNPLNPYGLSKNEFDKWVLHQKDHPNFWAGLKFFNVYGPNEYHKGRMASVIFHSFNQIKKGGKVRLFKSHRPDFKDGEQLRDFIYVKDVLKVCYWLMQHQPTSGIYNLGTGTARSFRDLATSTFKGLDMEPDILYIDMPEDIRGTYQYFTEANMQKLRSVGYMDTFYTLEKGVDDYVRNYLAKEKYY